MNCQTCGQGWPTRTATYGTATGWIRLCDTCLFADMPKDTATASYAGGWDNEALAQARMGFGLTEDTA